MSSSDWACARSWSEGELDVTRLLAGLGPEGTVTWYGQQFPAAGIEHPGLPDALPCAQGLEPHARRDLDRRFPQAVACPPGEERDPPEDTTLEHYGLSIGSTNTTNTSAITKRVSTKAAEQQPASASSGYLSHIYIYIYAPRSFLMSSFLIVLVCSYNRKNKGQLPTHRLNTSDFRAIRNERGVCCCWHAAATAAGADLRA